MEQFEYKLLLTTSGTGSRLGEITKNVNKSLVLLNGKETICYILDSYPTNIPVVVTLGYLGQSVKDFLERKYPERVFEFVWVDLYEGEGSSLGFSMLKAKDHLQCPFIFHACDGIFIEKIPEPDHNWIGVYVEDWNTSTLPLHQYRTHALKDGSVLHFNERGASKFDSIHVGLDGIYDYQKYWSTLEEIYCMDTKDSQISDVSVLSKMVERGISFEFVPYAVWLDTGNTDSLEKTIKQLKSFSLK